jgi:ATP-dependent helicase/nuclease subunit A
LEYFDFSKTDEFSQQIENMVKSNVLSQEQVDKINLSRLKNAVLGSVLKDLCGYKLYREKDFIVGIPASMLFDTKSQELIVVQGIIDLLAIKEDGAKIIDYKYSSLDSESLKKHYKLQLDIYAYAVEKVLGRPVTSKTLVNIFTGESIDV